MKTIVLPGVIGLSKLALTTFPDATNATFVCSIDTGTGADLSSIDNEIEAVSRVASVTVTVTGVAPAVVGVPLITPEPEFRFRPAGSEGASQEYGGVPPVACNVCE